MVAALQRLEANERIRELLSTYCRLADSGQFRSMAELFVPVEGYVEGGVVGFHQGRTAIAEAFERLAASSPTVVAHLTGNVTIRHDNAGSASVSSLFIGPLQDEGGPVIVGAVGRYDDRVIEVDAAWMFASRRISLDMLSDHRWGPPALVD